MCLVRLHAYALLVVVLAGLFGQLPVRAQEPSASGDNNPTTILFTIVDENKRFVTSLRKEDIRVLEDGTPQDIALFQQQSDQQLSLVIMLDTSVSQERVLPNAKLVARSFVNSIIRPGKDWMAVVTFTGVATVEKSLTNDLAQVQQAIDRVAFNPPPGYVGKGQLVMGSPPPTRSTPQFLLGSTAIWDTIWITLEKVLAPAPADSRRAIVLLTDGEDTSSQMKMSEAIDRAIKADAAIFTIGIGDAEYGGVNKEALRKMSERTGGRSFFPKKLSDLQTIFAEIEQELRSQYLITYSPTNKQRIDSLRKIRIEIINPELRKRKLRLLYRQGYYAKARMKNEGGGTK